MGSGQLEYRTKRNYPAADLGDRGRRVAVQVTNEQSSSKIRRTATRAEEHELGGEFDRLIILFFVPKKPGLPKTFVQPPSGPTIETWDLADLLEQMQELDLEALDRAGAVLDEEMGRVPRASSRAKESMFRRSSSTHPSS